MTHIPSAHDPVPLPEQDALDALIDRSVDLDAGWAALVELKPAAARLDIEHAPADSTRIKLDSSAHAGGASRLESIVQVLTEMIGQLGKTSSFAETTRRHCPSAVDRIATARGLLDDLRRHLQDRTCDRTTALTIIGMTRRQLTVANSQLEQALFVRELDGPRSLVQKAANQLKVLQPAILRLFDDADHFLPCGDPR